MFCKSSVGTAGLQVHEQQGTVLSGCCVLIVSRQNAHGLSPTRPETQTNPEPHNKTLEFWVLGLLRRAFYSLGLCVFWSMIDGFPHNVAFAIEMLNKLAVGTREGARGPAEGLPATASELFHCCSLFLHLRNCFHRSLTQKGQQPSTNVLQACDF